MAIKHSSYDKGASQDLTAVCADRRFSLGIFEPGSYNFGITEERNEFWIIFGGPVFAKGDQKFNDLLHGAEKIVFIAGERIELRCEWTTAYLRLFG